jgi:hypothetical protein
MPLILFNDNLGAKLIQNKIRKPKIALDIGANIGNHSVRLFSSLFKKVHCFEPHNEIFQLLAINTHKYKNISIHPFGLSNKQKKIILASDKNNMGATHIINVKKEREKGGRIAKVSEGWYRSRGIVKKLDQISNISYLWYIFSIGKAITWLKNDFLVKPELSASRVLLSLPWAVVHAPVASAPVALASRRKGLILGILGILGI